jgi:hypothetical protein
MTTTGRISRVQESILGKFSGEMRESGCDAVVVIATQTKRNKTESFIAQFGNELLCNSLITHAYNTEAIIYTDDEGDHPDA